MTKLCARKISQLKVIEPTDSLRLKAITALRGYNDYAFAASQDFMKQPDLLYVEAVLVTEGINDNDDGFIHNELRKAQCTPVLKPINIYHKDTDIIGVMYSVEARKLDGNPVVEDDNSPFELVISGVIWHYLPHIRKTAADIVMKFSKGEAFVSMECWFEGYDYGLYDKDGNFIDVIERCDDTAYLEKYLRVCGGTGNLNGKRIGRALKGITFGGVGIVDVPANRRSVMLDVFIFSSDKEDKSVATNVIRKNYLEDYMNDISTQKAVAASADVREEVREGVEKALETRERAEAVKKAQAELDGLRTEVTDLRQKLSASEKSRKAVEDTVDVQFNALRAEAGATGSTPPEIVKIDEAIRRGGDGEDVFNAKLDWIVNSRSSVSKTLAEELKKVKAENDELNSKLREVTRTEEIQEVFTGVLSENEVSAMVKRGLAKSDSDYTEWLEEKKVLVARMSKTDKKKGKAGQLVPEGDTEVLQDNGVSLRSECGKVPGSVPGPKSLASVEDLSDLFEEVDEADLAGAEASTEDDARENPYEKLVAKMLEKPQRRTLGVVNKQGGN